LADRETLWFCFAGNTRYLNCRAQTAQDTGLCQTLITEFGHSTACYCDGCVRYDADSRTCRPACTGLNSECAPAPAEGVYTCVPP
jgi:hypothetical protein